MGLINQHKKIMKKKSKLNKNNKHSIIKYVGLSLLTIGIAIAVILLVLFIFYMFSMYYKTHQDLFDRIILIIIFLFLIICLSFMFKTIDECDG